METGKFINFLLDYNKLSNIKQAEKILQKAKSLIAEGTKGVAITYSANYEQTVVIEQTYMKEGWNTNTSGANQADVIKEMLTLLKGEYQDLQGKMRIVPITTMTIVGAPYLSLFDKAHLGIVISDLIRIESYLESGWNILGWQNQKTVGSSAHPYAIGGGIANLTKEMNDLIQNKLIEFSSNFKSK